MQPLERPRKTDPGVMRVSSRMFIERNSQDETQATRATAGGSEVG